ncbi:hypothetical protein AZA_78664 [Nitrospirillum viridazoti Y2]|nr:hypothetical protein AZA_78664 [Nitrospirillum amazonense Y2]
MVGISACRGDSQHHHQHGQQDTQHGVQQNGDAYRFQDARHQTPPPIPPAPAQAGPFLRDYRVMVGATPPLA